MFRASGRCCRDVDGVTAPFSTELAAMGLQSRCVRQGAFAGSDYPHRAGTSHHQRQPKHSYLQKQLRKLGQRGKERCGRRANERAEVANQMRFVTVATIHRNSGQRFWCLLARNRQTLIAAHDSRRRAPRIGLFYSLNARVFLQGTSTGCGQRAQRAIGCHPRRPCQEQRMVRERSTTCPPAVSCGPAPTHPPARPNRHE